MLVHNVFFWLKPDLSAEQRELFRSGLQNLRYIESVRELYVGQPVDTKRPVADATFTFNLTVLTPDRQGLEAYSVDPAHKAFVEKFSSYWEKIIVYDAA